MLPRAQLHFFNEELKKLAAAPFLITRLTNTGGKYTPLAPVSSGSAQSTQRHSYYLREKAKLLAENRSYRLQNKEVLRKKAKRYRRAIQSGIRHQRQRFHTGSGYVYAGNK